MSKKESTNMDRELLFVPMKRNDAKAKTVGEYLQKLLYTLFEEGEGFSGKRPFGNSGWDYEVFAALIAAGKVEGGKLDENGYVEEEGNAYQVVRRAIKALITE